MRPVSEAGASAFVEAFQDPAIAEGAYHGQIAAIEEAVQPYLKRNVERMEAGDAVLLGVWEAGAERLSGQTMVFNIDWDERTAELGFWVAPWALFRRFSLHAADSIRGPSTEAVVKRSTPRHAPHTIAFLAPPMLTRSRPRRGLLALLIVGLLLAPGRAALAAVPVTQVSSDPYINASSQHRTEVEPDTFGFGTTIVGAFQVGRFYDGGSSNIGWARSGNGGSTWSHGYLPGTTTFAGGAYARVSDPSVAYDARHKVWLVSSLGLSSSVAPVAVLVSRSSTGGTTWGKPVLAASKPSGSPDKNWTVCDNTSTSPYYGRCYTEWDDNADGNRIKMSTSADGGLTWGPARNTADNATGLGGQPVVRPNGAVVVPIDNANETAVRVFRSTNGGASWGSTVTVTSIATHSVAGGLRTGPLPSAEIDGAGRVYVVWQDCRFRASCAANDIVLSSSADGVTWTAVRRIPIDPTTSSIDHFVPGVAVDRATSGSTARLGLTYHYYPTANCTSSSCRLYAGYVSSANGGSTWSAPTQLAGPMTLSWLPATSLGRMFGDYISTSFVGGRAYPLLSLAKTPSGTVFNQAMYLPTGGLAASGGTTRLATARALGAAKSSVSRRGRDVPRTSR